MDKELLVPAGNKEALKIAVINADAVYIGGKSFGARAYADNFTLDELKEAVSYAHLYGVKVYVTVNIMIFEREFKQVIDYILYLHSINVDAIIVSDIGVISYLSKNYPDIVIHLSTQAHVNNEAQIRQFKKLGVKRIVLNRELSLEEINKLPDIMEYEVFIHGALCVSYSGWCLMSYFKMKRSGNRGCCAGICRLPFNLYYQNKKVPLKNPYLLSTKELYTASYLEKLMQSKVKSFKIEGRMKSLAYVGFVSQFYKDLMNQYKETKKIVIDKSKEKQLEYLYHRKFTEGYLFNSNNIMNYESSNHIGGKIGKVINVNKNMIQIKLSEDLNQEDGIRFVKANKGMIVNYLYDKNKKLINKASKGQIIWVDNKLNIKTKDEVFKTLSRQLEHFYENISIPKIPIYGEIEVKKDGLWVMISDKINVVQQNFMIVSEPKNIVITKEDILRQFNKLGNTPFSFLNLKVTIKDKVFINIKDLNEARRTMINLLKQRRMK